MALGKSVAMREYKVVVLGSGGVGKSALSVKFVTGTFVEKYDPTIEDFYRKEIEVEQFASMRDLYIKNGQGFVVVFSITSLQTFQDIRTMKEQITRVKGTLQVPLLLVGNKCDLASQREVPIADGMMLAQLWGCPFMESSAKSKVNVNEVFIEIVREMNCAPVKKQRRCCTLL